MASKEENLISHSATAIENEILRVENNFNTSSNKKLYYKIANSQIFGIIPPGSQNQFSNFRSNYPSLFGFNGNSNSGDYICFEDRKSTHGIELLNNGASNPMQIRIIPVAPFNSSLDPNIRNIIRTGTKTQSINPNIINDRDYPSKVNIINNLDINIAINYITNAGANSSETILRGKTISYDNNSIENFFFIFTIVEAKCPNNIDCATYPVCKYANGSNPFCFYHINMGSKLYSVSLRFDENFSTQPILKIIGEPPAPQEINLTIEPDTL